MPENTKNIKQKLDLLEERSDQVKEILGKAPNWVIRSGITVVFVIVVLLILGSAIISYNDIIPAEITITSKNPPIYLKANATGRLTHVFVKPNSFVKEHEVLAEIENTATLDDALYLRNKMDAFVPNIETLDTLRVEFPPYLSLGTMQTAYGNFLNQYQNFILYNTLAPNARTSSSLTKQIAEENRLFANQQDQLALFKEDLELSQASYERNKKLFDKGVISKSEFETASRAYLTDKQQYEGFRATISRTRQTINDFNNSLVTNSIEGTETKNNYKQQLEAAYQNLNIELLAWEQQYLLKSPIEGKVTVFDIWDQYQNVSAGETLFTIIPSDLEDIIGRVSLPIRNSGKVKVGQKVLIKLANYPFEEWGSLEGKITNISEVPKQGEESYYTLYIEIENLETSYGKEVDFKQEMQGTAEIIVEELTVLQRIFYQLRKAFDQFD